MIALGVATGFMSGLFGVGGGILMVPGLVFFARFDQRRAHATSLAAMLPIALAGLITYVINDGIDWPLTGLLALGSVFGAVVGTALLTRMSKRALTIVFAVPLVIAAVRMLFEVTAEGRAPLTLWTAVIIVVIGLLTSAIASLLGIGGGIILVPLLTVLFDVPPVIAKGTALAVILPMSTVGTMRNRTNSLVDFKAAFALGVTGVAMAPVGAMVSNSISAQTSNALFAALLAMVTTRMLWQAVKG